MKMIERFSGVFLIAGLGLFLVAFLTLAMVPVAMLEKLPSKADLPTYVPESFQQDFPSGEAYRAALVRGRDLYIREACWHCHSQFVRPTANENLRYGPVSTPAESQNILSLPQLFGTRRVGPDLSRQSGKHPNDWQYAHLFQPTSVVPQSVMPSYSWYFELKDGKPVPKADAKAIVAYLQWLGADWNQREETADDFEQASLPPNE